MIIHSFLTDGFMGWGEIFLESFKYYHNEDIKIILDTRDLNDKQTQKLKHIYQNVEIFNKNIDYKKLTSKTGLDKGTLMGFKNAVENNSVSTKNKVWKLFVSVEERYRDSIWRCYQQHKDTEDFMIHMDIDIYFRSNLQKLFNFIKQYDISIRFRHKAIEKGRENRCVLGNLMSFRFCTEVEEFLKTWQKVIDSVDLKDKHKGFGQTSFWRAYLKHKNLSWGNIPPEMKVKNNAKNSLMWSANKGSKTKNLNICKEEMEGLC